MSSYRSFRVGVAALGAVLAVACADLSSPLEPREAPSFSRAAGDVGGGQFKALGRLSQSGSLAPATAHEVIGPAGGSISVGGVTLDVTAGALPEPVRITLTVPKGRFVQAQFQPHGLEFQGDGAKLSFDLTQTAGGTTFGADDLVGLYLGNGTIALNGWVTGLETFPVSLVGGTAEFWITHFSGYIVASGRSARGF